MSCIQADTVQAARQDLVPKVRNEIVRDLVKCTEHALCFFVILFVIYICTIIHFCLFILLLNNTSHVYMSYFTTRKNNSGICMLLHCLHDALHKKRKEKTV